MKKKMVIWGLVVAMCLSACGKAEPAKEDAKSEASVASETTVEASAASETTSEESVVSETNEQSVEVLADVKEEEKKSDFFAIRPITSITNEMPEGIYTPGETSKSFSDDFARYKKNGCTLYVETETWPLLERDFYRKKFPHAIVETCDSTDNGETFTEMVERISTSVEEMFSKEELYAGHEGEISSYCFSPDGKRACLIFYEAKEKAVNVLLFQHIGHKESKKGVVTDYYMYIITGEKTSKIDDADTFYEELNALGIFFD